MKAQQEIKKLLSDKGYKIEVYRYETVSYYSEGREGGYHITLDDELLSDEEYGKIEEFSNTVFNANGSVAACINMFTITGYNLKGVKELIATLPDLTLDTK